jgi:glycosyltransferase involved in cell wall biosynthesis
VDVASLLGARVPRTEARTRLGLPTEGSVIGVVGRLAPVKDHLTFFEAAARVVADRPDTTIVVAGDGQLRSSLEARARATLGDRVRFLGWVDDLPALYGAVDIVALTSRSEGTPVALIEAAASGTPVVATGVGGVPDVVRDRKTGLLVPPGDPVAVAAQLLTLLQDPQGAQKMGEEGASWVQGRFSQERLADDLTRLYGELLARARPRPTQVALSPSVAAG